MYKNVDHVIKSSVREIEHTLFKRFEEIIPDIKEAALDIYEDLLLGVVVNKKSLSNPEYFFDTYAERIDAFDYLSLSGGSLNLEIPNEDTFDFSGELVILKFIVEGTNGSYLELPETDLNAILKTKGLDDKIKRRFRSLPGITASDVSTKRRFRLISVRDNLAKLAQDILDKKLVYFPFSNQPPVDLFVELKEFVDNNIEDWISGAIDTSIVNIMAAN